MFRVLIDTLIGEESDYKNDDALCIRNESTGVII